MPTPSWMSGMSRAPGKDGHGRAWPWAWQGHGCGPQPCGLSIGSCAYGTRGAASPGTAAGQTSGHTGRGTCGVSSCRMAAARVSSGWSTATLSGTTHRSPWCIQHLSQELGLFTAWHGVLLLGPCPWVSLRAWRPRRCPQTTARTGVSEHRFQELPAAKRACCGHPAQGRMLCGQLGGGCSADCPLTAQVLRLRGYLQGALGLAGGTGARQLPQLGQRAGGRDGPHGAGACLPGVCPLPGGQQVGLADWGRDGGVLRV